MDTALRVSVNTPINGGEWPVPIPNDLLLERLRVELLNYNIEYVWLDVLCLRQEGRPEMEDVRMKEWEVDVPTIGSLYGQNSINGIIVTYFSGLGKPFRIGDLKNERHWLNRAWTFQESKPTTIIAGITDKSPFPPKYDGPWRLPDSTSDVKSFYSSLGLACVSSFGPRSIYAALESMRQRSAVHVVDKIAGLGYPLISATLPAYIRNNEPTVGENAWTRLIETMNASYRGDLFFLYPSPGNKPHMWRPSWEQVADCLPGVNGVHLVAEVDLDERHNTYQYKGHDVAGCVVKGLSRESQDGHCRHGKVTISHNGADHSFAIVAHHQHPIPEGRYSLLGNATGREGSDAPLTYWAVGHMQADGRSFEKVSVVRIESAKDRAQMKTLKLITQKSVTLL
ncbi:hypothetical protein EIP86_007211 [Pleurotus ostreatoroseus]|nr:hypothetical protein EIP86_007211 [Pleurotus ostreatoroseus]